MIDYHTLFEVLLDHDERMIERKNKKIFGRCSSIRGYVSGSFMN